MQPHSSRFGETTCFTPPFFCLFIGQVPPPPIPYPPESYEQSTPADPEAQREWLLDHLTTDLQAQGKLNAQSSRMSSEG